MGHSVDPELASYLEASLPTKMPSEAQTYELTPGSVLFVPRGYWHATEAQGDALALNFTFSAPTWIDLFTVALKSRLSQVPEWRETVSGLTDPEIQIISERKFDSLLSTLAQEMPHWRASDILNVTEFDS
jgi:50S ribosomal protein L16 3-hydroxylase